MHFQTITYDFVSHIGGIETNYENISSDFVLEISSIVTVFNYTIVLCLVENFLHAVGSQFNDRILFES